MMGRLCVSLGRGGGENVPSRLHDVQVGWYRRASKGAGRSEAHAIRSLPAVYGPLRGSVEHRLTFVRPLHQKGLVITRAGRH